MQRTKPGEGGAKQDTEEETDGWGNINEEFHDLHPVPNIIRNKMSNKKN
jgi:hypothetical protein